MKKIINSAVFRFSSTLCSFRFLIVSVGKMQSIEASIGSLTPKLQVSFSDVVIFTHNFSKYSKCRSSRPEVFYRNGVLRNFAKFTEKHLCQSFFFNKVATLLKKRIWHRCFPVNFAKLLRTPLFT